MGKFNPEDRISKYLQKHQYRYVSPVWNLYSMTRDVKGGKWKVFELPWTYVLNLNNFDTYIEIHFYDEKGVEYRDMRKGKTLGPKETLAYMPDDRPVLNGEARGGWYEVISNAPVKVTGEVHSQNHGISEYSGESRRTLTFFEV